MFNAVAEAARDRWGHAEELLVAAVQRMELLFRVTVLANRDPKQPKPQFGPLFDYPRPGKDTAAAPASRATHPRDIARRMLTGGG